MTKDIIKRALHGLFFCCILLLPAWLYTGCSSVQSSGAGTLSAQASATQSSGTSLSATQSSGAQSSAAQLFGSSASEQAGVREKPNVILIMADDLGWGDVGFNGNKIVQTPALDKMAGEGIVFSRFYAAAPVCSPTRGSCLTGRHPYRYGVESANVGKMKSGELTLAEYLQQQGYRTGHFGKWHLGTLTNNEPDANRGGKDPAAYSPPWENGFEVCFSTESKVPTWDPMVTPDSDAGDIGKRIPGTPFGTSYWTGPDQKVSENLSDDDSRVVMDRVIPFVEQQSRNNQPFLAVIWFHTPHLPVLTGEKYRQRYEGLPHDVQQFYGSISAMDEQIGRLRERLIALGLSENTLIFFTSDNGPEGKAQEGRTQGSTGGFKGRKRSLHEGGIRVPGIAVWPANIKGGLRTDYPAVTSDYFPTVREILGDTSQPQVSPVDGISLLAVWQQRLREREAPIGFQFGKQKAAIDNRYKLYVNGTNAPELYDLLDDPFETRNIAGDRPGELRRMQAYLEKFVRSCAASNAGADY